MDLSAASCEDGLGAITTDQTGFGVAWGISFLTAWVKLESTDQ
jgi:leucyl aminopeptidase